MSAMQRIKPADPAATLEPLRRRDTELKGQLVAHDQEMRGLAFASACGDQAATRRLGELRADVDRTQAELATIAMAIGGAQCRIQYAADRAAKAQQRERGHACVR